jgi:hypothetical protein
MRAQAKAAVRSIQTARLPVVFSFAGGYLTSLKLAMSGFPLTARRSFRVPLNKVS